MKDRRVGPFERRRSFLTEKRYFERLGDGHYELGYPDVGLTFTVTHLHRGRELDLVGELKVATTITGARVIDGNVLSVAMMNFSSQQTRTSRAKFLAERAVTEDLDWVGALETLSALIMQAEEEGPSIRRLIDFDEDLQADETWMVEGIPILKDQPMIFFGDGGTGKSYLALWIAIQLAKRQVSVLYADWEYTGRAHKKRLRQLADSVIIPDIHYASCTKPITLEMPALRAYIIKHKIRYLICDSIAQAIGGRPEEAEHANAYWRAVRACEVGSLHLAHITKQLDTEALPDKPFGSTFFSNQARSTWFLKRAEESDEPDCIEVALHHRKVNDGARLPATGLRLTFSGPKVRVSKFDVSDHDEHARTLKVPARMKGALKRGPMELEALAAKINAKEDTVRKAASRGAFTKTSDGRIALVAHRDESF